MRFQAVWPLIRRDGFFISSLPPDILNFQNNDHLMKTYLIAACVILPLLTSAQATSYGNFNVADQEIIY